MNGSRFVGAATASVRVAYPNMPNYFVNQTSRFSALCACCQSL